jgi:hypothetical protein
LLQGSLRDRALEAAGSIAVDLAQLAPPQLDLERTFSHSLAYGGAGIALFLHYWDSAVPDRCIRHGAEQYLDQVIAGMEERRMSCALFRGFTGIAWAALHVYRRWGEVLAAPVWEHLDQAVDAWTHRQATPTELLEGLGGILLYLAERDVEPVTQALFERVVARLHQVALERGAGRAWPVADWLQKDYEWHLTLSSRERFKLSDHWLQQGMRGYYKLGVAHGCTGTAAALAAARVAGYEAPGAADMAASAAQFVTMPSSICPRRCRTGYLSRIFARCCSRMIHCRDIFRSEFGSSRKEIGAAGELFRKFRPQLLDTIRRTRGLARSEDAEDFIGDLQSLRELCDEHQVTPIGEGGRSVGPLISRELATDFCHLHCNRMLHGSQRMQELVIYDLLVRAYDAVVHGVWADGQ